MGTTIEEQRGDLEVVAVAALHERTAFQKEARGLEMAVLRGLVSGVLPDLLRTAIEASASSAASISAR